MPSLRTGGDKPRPPERWHAPRGRSLEIFLPRARRNALDCALWDLRCKRSNRSIWSLLDLEPRPVTTAFTLTSTPRQWPARRAAGYPGARAEARRRAPGGTPCRRARRAPRRRVARCDTNGSWTPELLADLGPFKRVPSSSSRCRRAVLRLALPVPLCATRYCQSSADLEAYGCRSSTSSSKCGGLTDALRMVERSAPSALELHGRQHARLVAGDGAGVRGGAVVQLVDLDGPLLQRRVQCGTKGRD